MLTVPQNDKRRETERVPQFTIEKITLDQAEIKARRWVGSVPIYPTIERSEVQIQNIAQWCGSFGRAVASNTRGLGLNPVISKKLY